MSHLLRPHRGLILQVNRAVDSTGGRRMLAVGRLACPDCRGFQAVKVRASRGLRTETCSTCTPAGR